MKKIVCSLFLVAALNGNAQLAPGSIAPDFTLTDINGVQHNLYDYLDQGKTVFIDVSATWCGPCWAFHSAGILDDLWAEHGPLGGPGVNANTTDDVIVLFIEGDGSTTSAELHGGAGSQGDWVTGVEHPIIDPPAGIINSFNNTYDIAYYPTIYRVCQNRIIDEPGQVSTAELYNTISTCPAPASDPSDVVFASYNAATVICGPSSYIPVVRFQNYGLTNLTNATITIKEGTTTVSSGTYSGALQPYEYATVNCSAIANYSGGTLLVEVSTTGETNTANNVSSITINAAPEVKSRLLLSVVTDGAAYTLGWKIKDASGVVVPGTTDPVLSNNSPYNFTYDLPATGCYTYSITDQYGNGTTSINLRDVDNTSLLTDAAFGTGINVPFKVVEMFVLALDENSEHTLQVYPNPTDGKLTIKSEDLSSYQTLDLLDQTGRVLLSWKISSTVMDLELKEIATGNYKLVFKGTNGNHIQKVQVNR